MKLPRIRKWLRDHHTDVMWASMMLVIAAFFIMLMIVSWPEPPPTRDYTVPPSVRRTTIEASLAALVVLDKCHRDAPAHLPAAAASKWRDICANALRAVEHSP